MLAAGDTSIVMRIRKYPYTSRIYANALCDHGNPCAAYGRWKSVSSMSTTQLVQNTNTLGRLLCDGSSHPSSQAFACRLRNLWQLSPNVVQPETEVWSMEVRVRQANRQAEQKAIIQHAGGNYGRMSCDGNPHVRANHPPAQAG